MKKSNQEKMDDIQNDMDATADRILRNNTIANKLPETAKVQASNKNEKNCPNCKYYKPIEEEIFLRDGKQVSKKSFPRTCGKGETETMNKWFKAKSHKELDCFTQE